MGSMEVVKGLPLGQLSGEISRWVLGMLIHDLLRVEYHTPPVRLTREFAKPFSFLFPFPGPSG